MERKDCSDLSCAECFLMGDTVPDWPQRIQCKKLQEFQISTMENEGGICVDEEVNHTNRPIKEAVSPLQIH